MRTFGKKLTEYFEFQLEDDEKVYRIPLAAAMPFSLLDRMSKAADTEDRFTAQVDMLRKYMGDVVDDLPVGVLSEILKAWGKESTRAGASMGES